LDENLANEYLDKMEKADNPGAVLASFYAKLFDFPFDSRMIPLFARSVKLYGRFIVFMSLVDMYEIPNLDHQKIFALINYLCKKRLMAGSSTAVSNMKDEIREHEQKIKELKKMKLEIRNPFYE